MDFWRGHRLYSGLASSLTGPSKVLVGSCKAWGQVGVTVEKLPSSSRNENAITIIAKPKIVFNVVPVDKKNFRSITLFTVANVSQRNNE